MKENETTFSLAALRKLMHALGVDFRKHPKHWGYRNYYAADSIDPDLEQLVAHGLMTRHVRDAEHIWGSGVTYCATETGRRLFELKPPKVALPVLLSIKPCWADLIAAGTKTVELRRSFAVQVFPTWAYLYESTPVKAITGRVKITNAFKINAFYGSEYYIYRACVTKSELEAYRGNRQTLMALELKNYQPLEPVSLSALGIKAPQSWRYLDQSHEDLILAAKEDSLVD